jgi:ketosteroid isomerase-like protein
VTVSSLAAGAAAGLGARALLARAVKLKFERDLAALNAGKPDSLLRGYADDAVLVFPEGDHRWSGEHRGRAGIERFLREFTAAGLHGELRQVLIAGPPWAMTIMARFDDSATAPDGGEEYRNRVAIVLQTRWGKVVRHEDFFEDTQRIERFEARLRARGVAPVAAAAAA